jgi:hypothetical protein
VNKKAHVTKFIRNTVISIVVLLVLFVGGGVAYTWYMGQNNDSASAATAPVKAKPELVVKHVQPGANTPESASVQSITSPVIPGTNSSVTVRTKADSVCKITVVYDKTASTDSGLVAKIADEFGMVSWSWTVGDSVPLGKWPVTVTCTHSGKSAVVVGDLLVTKVIQ